jgi:hypothetical protein
MTLNEISDLYAREGLTAMEALPEADFMKWATSVLADTELLRNEANQLMKRADRRLVDLGRVMNSRRYIAEAKKETETKAA